MCPSLSISTFWKVPQFRIAILYWRHTIQFEKIQLNVSYFWPLKSKLDTPSKTIKVSPKIIPNEIFLWFIRSVLVRKMLRNVEETRPARADEILYQKRCSLAFDGNGICEHILWYVLWSPIRYKLMEHTSHPPSVVYWDFGFHI